MTSRARDFTLSSVKVSGKTKVYGIIGYPVTHSLSPVFQNWFLQKNGEDAVYVPFPVVPEQLTAALSGLLASQIAGLNVTVPHKESVLSLVQADQNALSIGAVNTLKVVDGLWHGINTDWLGFRRVLQGLQVNPGEAALLFGAGGTARAVLHALDAHGVKQVYLCNRSQQRVDALVTHATVHYPQMELTPLPWQQADIELASHQCGILVNTTSIGLAQEDVFPFVCYGHGVAIDAVYRPDASTAFCRAVSGGDRVVVDGLPMLIAQGAAAYAWWFNQQEPDTWHALQWMANKLQRQQTDLPGWRVEG